MIGAARHGGQDWTAAMTPDSRTLLERLAADAEQLAVLDQVLGRWPYRARLDASTEVSGSWVTDPGARESVATGVRARLRDEAVERFGEDVMLLGIGASWTANADGSHTVLCTGLALPAPRDDQATTVIPVVPPERTAP